MKLPLVLLGLAAAGSAFALPQDHSGPAGHTGFPGGMPANATGANCARDCLRQDEAHAIVDKLVSVLEHNDDTAAHATASELIADDFAGWSDSIRILRGQTLGQAAYPDKKSYIDDVFSTRNPPSTGGHQTKSVLVAGCDKILWQWKFTKVGSGKYPVSGFDLLYIKDKKQIRQIDFELNTVAWGVNTGLECYRNGTQLK